MSKSPSRVVIIDPSFLNFIGHHAQYDVSIYEAALEKNIPCKILGHKNMVVKVGGSDKSLFPLFTEDMWGNNKCLGSFLLDLKILLLGFISFILAPSLSGPRIKGIKEWAQKYYHYRKQSNYSFLKKSNYFLLFLAYGLTRLAPTIFYDQKIYRLSIKSLTKRLYTLWMPVFISQFLAGLGKIIIKITNRLIIVFKKIKSFSRLLLRFFLPPIIFNLFSRVDYLPNKFFKLLIRIFYIFTPMIVIDFVRGAREWISRKNLIARIPSGLSLIFCPNQRYYMECIKGLNQVKLDKGDLVYFHMVIGNNFLETMILCEKIFQKTHVSPVVLFRYPINFLKTAAKITQKIAFRKMEFLFETRQIRVASDSERLISYYGNVTYVPMELFPIPHTKDADLDEITALKLQNPRIIKIASLGNARGEKGFPEIVMAMDLLSKLPSLRDRVSFVLQVNDPDADAKPWVKKLRLSKFPFPVTFITKSLSKLEYESLFKSVDVVLAPYWQEVYESRTSGIAIEALAGGKTLITTKNTWMSDVVAEFKVGLTVNNHDPLDLANKIIRAVSGQERFVKAALIASGEISKLHSPSRFLDHLVGEIQYCIPNKKRNILFLYPWNDLGTYKSGASVRASLVLKKITEAGNLVKVIGQIPANAELPVGVIREKISDDSLASFSNPLFVFDFICRLIFVPWRIGNEDFRFRYKYWRRSREFKLQLNKLLRNSTSVVMEYSFLGDLVGPFSYAYKINLIIDELDILADQGWNAFSKKHLLKSELQCLAQAQHVYCLSRDDFDFFLPKIPRAKLMPISLDLQKFEVMQKSRAKEILAKSNIFLPNKFAFFIGSNYGPNLEAVKHIFNFASICTISSSEFMYVTAGTCYQPHFEGLCESFMQLGLVSEEIMWALYSLASVVVIPLEKGTGSSIKTMEALAFGRLVVGTAHAFRGLDVEHQVNCIVAPSVCEIPDILDSILFENDRRRVELEDSAKLYSLNHDYEKIYQMLINSL
jgi:glycosyltransferase involved in cell wall biosynthesis